MMCGWLSGAGCASTRRCEKALLQPAPRVRKPDDAARRMLARTLALQGRRARGGFDRGGFKSDKTTVTFAKIFPLVVVYQ